MPCKLWFMCQYAVRDEIESCSNCRYFVQKIMVGNDAELVVCSSNLCPELVVETNKEENTKEEPKFKP